MVSYAVLPTSGFSEEKAMLQKLCQRSDLYDRFMVKVDRSTSYMEIKEGEKALSQLLRWCASKEISSAAVVGVLNLGRVSVQRLISLKRTWHSPGNRSSFPAPIDVARSGTRAVVVNCCQRTNSYC